MWVTFYMYPTAFPGYYQPNFSFVRGESHYVFGSLRDYPNGTSKEGRASDISMKK